MCFCWSGDLIYFSLLRNLSIVSLVCLHKVTFRTLPPCTLYLSFCRFWNASAFTHHTYSEAKKSKPGRLNPDFRNFIPREGSKSSTSYFRVWLEYLELSSKSIDFNNSFFLFWSSRRFWGMKRFYHNFVSVVEKKRMLSELGMTRVHGH